jgi:Flp pilus assembly protein CpaB
MENLKNMKVSIGLVIAIIVQAFGLIWYVAQLDSTVTNLDTSVTSIQEAQTTVDIAVLQADLENLKRLVEDLNFESIEDKNKQVLEAVWDMQEKISALETRDAVIENEMRTIMSDHSGFSDVLKQLNLAGYGDSRTYGDYD